MQGMYSMRSPAVKRLMKEAQELSEPTEQYYCQPLEDNLFEWHFTIRGPADTEFDGGLYHGRIVLPPEYPMKPPSIILLTHNGRFEVNKKICLSISGHHPESWQPSWSIRTALLAIIGFMPTHGAGALGSLDYSPDERKVLARRSVDFKCPDCGPINCTLKAVTEASLKTTEEARQLAAQMDFKDEKERNAALKDVGPACPSSPANTSVNTDQAAPSSSDAQGGARPKVPTTQAYPQPMQFGQFPMPMPFLPPFPMPGNAQNNQQNGSAILQQVPRFPLPFGAPMSPPFPPFMAPPFMPGMNFPPIPPGSLNPGTPLINTNITPNPPQVVPETVASLNNQSQSSSVTQSTESANQQTDNNPQTRTTTTENPLQTSDTTTTTTTTTTTSNLDETSNTSGEGLRQRNTTRPENVGSSLSSSPRVSVTSQTHAAPVIPTRSHRESPAFVAFAVIIIALIAMLLIRRLYIMKYLTGLI